MTGHTDPDRLIRAFLDEGIDELPDRAYEALRAATDHTRQRIVIGPWREPKMTRFSILGAAAVVVVALAVAAGLWLPRSGSNVGGVPDVTPSPVVAPTPAPIATPSPAPTRTPSLVEQPPVDEGLKPVPAGDQLPVELIGRKFIQADEPAGEVQNLVMTLRPATDPHCVAMFDGASTCFTLLWEPNLLGFHFNDPGARGGAVMRDGQLLLSYEIVPNDRTCEGNEVLYEVSGDGTSLELAGSNPACGFTLYESLETP